MNAKPNRHQSATDKLNELARNGSLHPHKTVLAIHHTSQRTVTCGVFASRGKRLVLLTSDGKKIRIAEHDIHSLHCLNAKNLDDVEAYAFHLLVLLGYHVQKKKCLVILDKIYRPNPFEARHIVDVALKMARNITTGS